MEWLLLSCSILLLGLIAYQDFRYRAVSVIVLALLFITYMVSGLQQLTLRELMMNTGVNVLIVVIELSVLVLFYFFKEGRLSSLTCNKLGWGDIVFFFILCVLFSPLNFILFYVLSLILVLAGTGLYRAIGRVSSPTVPLAGGMAVVLLLVQLMNTVFLRYNFYSDHQIFQWMLA